MTQTDDVVDDDLDLERVKLWTVIWFRTDGFSDVSEVRWETSEAAKEGAADYIYRIRRAEAFVKWSDGQILHNSSVSHFFPIPVRG